MTRRAFRIFVTISAALVLAAPFAVAPSRAEDVRSGIQSPLRTGGGKPGCRWVQGAAKTTRICNARTGQCREQTVPAQRIWACGTVRD